MKQAVKRQSRVQASDLARPSICQNLVTSPQLLQNSDLCIYEMQRISMPKSLQCCEELSTRYIGGTNQMVALVVIINITEAE